MICIDCSLCMPADSHDEEDNIDDFRIINYILKIKIINKEVYIYIKKEDKIHSILFVYLQHGKYNM